MQAILRAHSQSHAEMARRAGMAQRDTLSAQVQHQLGLDRPSAQVPGGMRRNSSAPMLHRDDDGLPKVVVGICGACLCTDVRAAGGTRGRGAASRDVRVAGDGEQEGQPAGAIRSVVVAAAGTASSPGRCRPHALPPTSSPLGLTLLLLFALHPLAAMDKKARSKQMNHIVERLLRYGEFEVVVFGDETILNTPVEDWPTCDCLLCWHSGAQRGGRGGRGGGGGGGLTRGWASLQRRLPPLPRLAVNWPRAAPKHPPAHPVRCRRLPAEEGAAIRSAAQAVPGQ